MALIVSGSSSSGDFKPVSEGVHLARCVTVVDMGMQETVWQGQVKFRHRIWIGFEIPGERVTWTDKDGNEKDGPAIIGSQYTASLSENAILYKHLISWRGKKFTPDELRAFDLFNVLGKPCQLSVTHNTSGDKTYANITGIMGIPAGMTVPAQETPTLRYSPTDAEASVMFDKLPPWLQEKCRVGHKLDDVSSGDTPVKVPNELPTEFDDAITF